MNFLPEQAIRDFQEAYLQDFGQEITEEEASMIGQNLLGLFDQIYRPIPIKKGEPP